MRAPMRHSSAACMNRFSKIVSEILLVPSASPSIAMNCACMSVGKPGNGLVIRSAARGRAGPWPRLRAAEAGARALARVGRARPRRALAADTVAGDDDRGAALLELGQHRRQVPRLRPG